MVQSAHVKLTFQLVDQKGRSHYDLGAVVQMGEKVKGPSKIFQALSNSSKGPFPKDGSCGLDLGREFCRIKVSLHNDSSLPVPSPTHTLFLYFRAVSVTLCFFSPSQRATDCSYHTTTPAAHCPHNMPKTDMLSLGKQEAQTQTGPDFYRILTVVRLTVTGSLKRCRSG